MVIKNELSQLLTLSVPILLLTFVSLWLGGLIGSKNKIWGNVRMLITFFIISVIYGVNIVPHKQWPISNDTMQGLIAVANVLTVPIVLSNLFEAKNPKSKTKTVTTETVNIDSNGVGHYEKITVTEEE